VADEKILGLLGEYDSTQEVCYLWPHRTAGAEVDSSYTRLFMDDALLQYFYSAASGGPDTIKATLCEPVSLFNITGGAKNYIHALTTNWKSYGSWDRDTQLQNRDVAIGDVAKVSAVVGSTVVTLWTYVAGFLHDEIAAIIGAASEDANNVDYGIEQSSSSSESPSYVITKIGFGTNDVEMSGFSAPEDRPEFAYQDGVQADIYTFEVLSGGTATEAILRVTTESGTDDVDELTLNTWGVATPFGSKNLEATFTNGVDNFEVGMQWEVVVEFGMGVVHPVSGGTYTGTEDTIYIIEVTRGGKFGSVTPPQITVSTTDGTDASGPHNVTALNTPVTIGSYGLTIEFTSDEISNMGLYLGDKYYIDVTAPSAGAVRGLILGHNLPDGLLGLEPDGSCGTAPALAVTLYIKKDIEVTEDRTGFAPQVNWVQSDTQICVEGSMVAYDSTWVDDAGILLPLDVMGGTLYVQYRALLLTYSDTVYTMDTGSIDLGPEVPDNPLAFGVMLAALNANGTVVKFIATAGIDVEAYNEALDKLTERDDLYSIVPLTFASDVRQACITHVNSMSTADIGRWRTLLVSIPVPNEKSILAQDSAGATLLATISDDPGTSGTQYTYLEITNAVTMIGTVLPGDIVRTGYTTDGFGNEIYSEYTVDEVLSEAALKLVSGPDMPVTVAQRVEIWRNLNSTQHAAEVVSTYGGLSNRRVCAVWPDYFNYSGESVEGYFLAAAIAGLRSGVVPHQGLTNVVLAGIDDVPRSTGFSRTELNTLAEVGVYIITRNSDGVVFCRHALTTDVTDINTREEMVTRNVDSISYVFLNALAPYIGIANVAPGTLAMISNVVTATTGYLINETFVEKLGSQLIAAAVTKLEQHATLRDRILIVIDVTIPYPNNNEELHLII
jgi:hypothetical protein